MFDVDTFNAFIKQHWLWIVTTIVIVWLAKKFLEHHGVDEGQIFFTAINVFIGLGLFIAFSAVFALIAILFGATWKTAILIGIGLTLLMIVFRI